MINITWFQSGSLETCSHQKKKKNSIKQGQRVWLLIVEFVHMIHVHLFTKQLLKPAHGTMSQPFS